MMWRMNHMRVSAIVVIATIVSAVPVGGIAFAASGHHKMKKRTAQAVAAGVPALPDAATLGQLRAMAVRAAAASGDQHPTQGRVYVGTRQGANGAVSGATVDTDQGVYVVIVHGNFVADYASRPVGHAAPHGTAITLIIDAATMTTTDIGITNDAWPTTLGPAVALNLAR